MYTSKRGTHTNLHAVPAGTVYSASKSCVTDGRTSSHRHVTSTYVQQKVSDRSFLLFFCFSSSVSFHCVTDGPLSSTGTLPRRETREGVAYAIATTLASITDSAVNHHEFPVSGF